MVEREGVWPSAGRLDEEENRGLDQRDSEDQGLHDEVFGDEEGQVSQHAPSERECDDLCLQWEGSTFDQWSNGFSVPRSAREPSVETVRAAHVACAGQKEKGRRRQSGDEDTDDSQNERHRAQHDQEGTPHWMSQTLLVIRSALHAERLYQIVRCARNSKDSCAAKRPFALSGNGCSRVARPLFAQEGASV